MSVTNPFFDVSALPYQAPRFDLIHQDHYRPAFDRGVEEKRAEVTAIAQNPAPATFDNTLLPLECSGELLTRETIVYFAMTSAHTNDFLQQLD